MLIWRSSRKTDSTYGRRVAFLYIDARLNFANKKYGNKLKKLKKSANSSNRSAFTGSVSVKVALPWLLTKRIG